MLPSIQLWLPLRSRLQLPLLLLLPLQLLLLPPLQLPLNLHNQLLLALALLSRLLCLAPSTPLT